ncbi:nucleic acid binding protein [Reticulomyxa filosa]|uniref:Nucleic acid binding protein n=1 Tax=Reticulomyxa filosa TaxID=46433 RepID=X6N1Z1_RETFI|nr:nucleic acid binding protein [Reticulomyxa filosa]|eukprot:ETO19764.1 nucleic acid binding protein [Reticulomyxa filosa]
MDNLKMNVLQVKPNTQSNKGIEIVDTDLIVEFAPPLDNSQDNWRNEYYHRSLVVGDEINDFIVFKTEEFRYYKLVLPYSLIDVSLDNDNDNDDGNNNRNQSLIKRVFVFFFFLKRRGGTICYALSIFLKKKKMYKHVYGQKKRKLPVIEIALTTEKRGLFDTDLYVSALNSKPGPLLNDYNDISNGSACVIVDVDELLKKVQSTNKNVISLKYLHIAVRGAFKSKSLPSEKSNEEKTKEDEDKMEYTLRINELDLASSSMSNLNRASSLQTHSTASKIDLSSDETKAFCENCQRYVNKWTFDRHLPHCLKQFFYCKTCDKLMKVDEKEKHESLYHQQIICDLCNEVSCNGRQELIKHQTQECSQRKVVCEYCHLSFPAEDLVSHENMCANRTELCPLCNEYITLAMIQVSIVLLCVEHSLTVHGVPFEQPIAMAKTKSDPDNTNATKYQLSSEFSVIPNRDYDKLLQNPDSNENDATKDSKSVTQMNNQKMDRKRKVDMHIMPIYESTQSQRMCDRDYDKLLQGKDESTTGQDPTSQQWMHKLKKEAQHDNIVQQSGSKADSVEKLSVIDPVNIPVRDYDKMTSEVEVLKTVQEQQPPDEDVEMLSAEDKVVRAANIPNRNYDAMFETGTAQHEDDVIIPPVTEEPPKTYNLSSRGTIPQRNYEQLLSSNNTTDTTQENIAKLKKHETWVCPNPKCEFLNRGTRQECQICHTLHPAHAKNRKSADDGEKYLGLTGKANLYWRERKEDITKQQKQNKKFYRWVCGHCETLNKSTRLSCVYCHRSRDHGKDVPMRDTEKSKTGAKGILHDEDLKQTHCKLCPPKQIKTKL